VSADRAIRILAAAVVLAVAGIAAVISYSHIRALALAHGQAGTAAMLLPLSVDGAVLAAALVMLRAARTGQQAPRLGRVMLGLGVAATIAANVLYGVGYGLLGAVISAWPAIAFIGSAEMALGMIRSARSAPEARITHAVGDSGADPEAQIGSSAADLEPVPGAYAELNGHREIAAAEFAAELADGKLPSLRAIQSRMHAGPVRARELQSYLRTHIETGGNPS
jgi:hypothetical protein